MGILDQWSKAQQSALSGVKSSIATDNSGSTSTDPMLVASNRKYLIQITQAQDIATVGTQGQPLIVIGQVPEELQMDQSVQWKAPWGAGLAGEGTVSDLLAVTMGSRLLAQVQTLQVWQGSGNDFDFTVIIEFRAWSDVDRDVMIPMQNLLAMSVPSVDPSTGWLRSPGPILDAAAVKAIGQGAVSVVSDLLSTAQSTATKALTDGQGGFKAAVSTIASVGSAAGQKLKTAKSELEQLLKNKVEVRIGDWFRMSNVVITNVQNTLKPQQPGPNGGVMAGTSTVTFRPMFAITTDDIQSILMTASTRGLSYGTNGSQGILNIGNSTTPNF
jgi:hypothetical protein